mmetsp:Transcript_7695/g.18855  ORF Transcript_7695/g.18855 Transcript_7695/m.18855 type:complete len:273 (+) Transcript_7695:1560-2378(+)
MGPSRPVQIGGFFRLLVLRLRVSNEIHHLVLSLTGNIGPADDDGGSVHPKGIRLELVIHPLLKCKSQLEHKIGSGGDAVRVEPLLVGGVLELLALEVFTGRQICCQLFGLLCRPEAARPLLVHFGAGGGSIDGKIQNLVGLDHFIETVHVQKDLFEHGGFVQKDKFVVVVSVRARVDNPVHVQIKVVDLNVLGQSLFEAVVDDIGILIREPAKHFGDSEESRARCRRRSGGKQLALFCCLCGQRRPTLGRGCKSIDVDAKRGNRQSGDKKIF